MSESGRKPPCTAQTLQNAPCGSWALPGRTTCQTHSPDRAEAVRAARAKGARMKALNGQRRRLDTPASLISFTSGVIQDALDGTTSAEVARTVLYGIGQQKSLLELLVKTEIEQRLTALEERAGVAQPQRGVRQWTA